ncbi:MAG: response regulator [Kosmotogaceae bacterium]
MKRLSKSVSLKFFIFVLSTMAILLIVLSFYFVTSAKNEYSTYLKDKKQIVMNWFVNFKKELRYAALTLVEKSEVPSGFDIVSIKDADNNVQLLANELDLSLEDADYFFNRSDSFFNLNGTVVYFSTFSFDESRILFGVSFEKEKITELTNYIGQDAILFLRTNEKLVIPYEFLESGIFVRDVLEAEENAEQMPFTISQSTPFFGFFEPKDVYLVDKLIIGNVDFFILQSQGLLAILKTRLFPIILILLGSVLAFSFIFSKSLNDYLSMALNTILKGFSSMRKGEYKRVELESDDELGQIAKDLNNTMGFIEKTQERLKKTNELLRKATVEAQQANKMKSEFLANMSHEMRTPMNAILGFAELLLSEETNKERKKYLDTIYKSGEHLLNLINDVLDLSKIESGHIEVYENVFSPKMLINQMIEMYYPMARSKKLHLASNIDDSVPKYILGDEFKIRQILTNLISNAIKFTNIGTITILGNYREGYMIYEVHDTGIGISKKRLENVFEPFVQIESNMSRRYGGSGLGLAITKRLVNLQNGTINLNSDPGKGTTAIVRIPSKIPSKTELSETVKDSKEKEDIAIMIVGKNEDCFDSLTNIFNKLGLKYKLVRDIPLITHYLKQDDYKLVIINLADFEETQRSYLLSEKFSSLNIPVIFIGSPSISKPSLHNSKFKVINDCSKEQELMEAVSGFIPNLKPFLSKKNIRILVVEDNEPNQLLIKKILERAGIIVDVSFNGKEAIQMILENEYDLVIMDIQMPVVDGYEATRKIRKMGNDIPIIALTAHTMQGDEKKSLESGCNAYLGKPIKQKELLDIVRTYIGSSEREVKSDETLLHTERKVDTELTDNKENRIKSFAENMGISLSEAKTMFEEYGNFLKERIELLKKFYENNDLKSIAVEGHSIKGSGTMYSVEEITKAGQRMEFSAKNGNIEEVLKTINEIEKIHERIWQD